MENARNNRNVNPCGLDGFAFLEFSGPNKTLLQDQFTNMGFHLRYSHKEQDISLYQQGKIQFILNAAKNTQAEEHATKHGAGACAMGFRVNNAKEAYQHAIEKGAIPFSDCSHANHHLLGIHAIGGSVIYFVDANHHPFANQWQENQTSSSTSLNKDCGLYEIDHLTHNVFRGNLEKWTQFYETIFNFHEIRFFNIKGKMTGLISKALSSPCNKIKIPLNESTDSQSQIEEFLHDFHGEGIQHIALNSQDIYQTVHLLRERSVKFLDVPATYYDFINKRIPWQKEPVEKLKQERILIDGEQEAQHGLLLQIFTENVFGPVFFEIIQRHGNQGFGEGNFQALFEAMERDQIRRGTL